MSIDLWRTRPLTNPLSQVSVQDETFATEGTLAFHASAGAKVVWQLRPESVRRDNLSS